VKSFLPSANLALIGDGVAVGCSEEKFSKFVVEMKPIADKVISGLEPAPVERLEHCNILLALCGCVSTGALLTFGFAFGCISVLFEYRSSRFVCHLVDE